VRPSGLYFVVIYFLVLAYLVYNRYPRRGTVLFSLALPSILLALCTYNYATTRNFVISAFGEANLAGATVLYWEPDPRLPEQVNRVLADLPNAYRAVGVTSEDLAKLSTSWDTDFLYHLFEKSYNPMIFQKGYNPVLGEWGYGAKFGSTDYINTTRKYIKQASLLAIRKHPDLYLKFVWANLVSYFSGIKYDYQFYPAIYFRAGANFASVGLEPEIAAAREYFRQSPPASVQIKGVGPEAVVTLTPHRLTELHRGWQTLHWKLFQTRFWLWSYWIMLALSFVQLVRHRGRHLGAFLLFVLMLMVLGSSLVICLVEIGLERYSYPTEFIYFLSLALAPLLGMNGEKRSPVQPVA
jgi:hypothetical protein